MKRLKTPGKIALFLILAFVLFFRNCISRSKTINDWHRERDEVYYMEEAAFAGIVTHKSSPHHRGDIDTLTLQLTHWACSDAHFTGSRYLKKVADSTLFLFIPYSQAIHPPNPIEEGDSIVKNPFTFDFTVYTPNKQQRKTLSLLLCAYEIPDSIIHKGNYMYGTYETSFYKEDTLFAGALIDGKRQGEWRYYQPHLKGYKLLEGAYKDDKREGVFKKYYESGNQLMYIETYQNNLPHGAFTWWYPDGQVESKRFFTQGKPTGTWEFYDGDGKLIRRERYD